MPTTIQNQSAFQRIEVIDALRGFSLAGIVFCHMLENFVASPIPMTAIEAMNPSIIDQIADGFVSFLFRGKFFALFSFLFGLSFFIQMDNGSKRGTSFGGRFFWRLVILFAIGFLHSMFYRGDILTLYAFLGVFLIPFYKVNNKWLLGIAALLFLGIGRYVVFYFTNGEGLFTKEELSPDSPMIAAYFELLQNGSIIEVFKSNAIEGNINKSEFQFGVFSRGYLTFGFFLLGLFIGRIEFFKNYLTKKKLIKRLWVGALILLGISIVSMAGIFSSMGPDVQFNSWTSMFGLTFFDLMNVAMTILIVAIFIILYKKNKPKKFLEKFIPYGKMALTNYVFQSIVGTFIFFGWGLGYLAKIPNSYVFLMAIVIITIQMWLSKIWQKYFYYGPLEWIWRSLTFFKLMPMKRKI
ncbi:DUF418 domain-containing protein [Croceitalea rosinachiae]|uniref:DUF418 domain-containing protein n=1 Tax=Croceitalea rosinachiae TaxID=3075596 RepID=A0ABU3ACJ5_9FLAO|nr:DUF418 domain-containing protein [Croceitalea sp. F388]MDT0607520.1 DUF418 domain-containing protein [Croceitalea sp. F388]